MNFRQKRELGSPTPSAADISPTGGEDLDEQYALKHFLGRDVQGALELLRKSFVDYEEDLLFMGRRGFEYYLPAVLLYLQELDADAFISEADSVFHLLRLRLVSKDSTGFSMKYYQMTAEQMLANTHACELREYCMTRLESLAEEEDSERNPGWLRKKAQRWRGLFG